MSYSTQDKVSLGLAAVSSFLSACLAYRKRLMQRQAERLEQCEEISVEDLLSSSSSLSALGNKSNENDKCERLRQERTPVALRGEVVCMMKDASTDVTGIDSLSGDKMAVRRRMRREITQKIRGMTTPLPGVVLTPVTEVTLKTDTIDEVPKWGLKSSDATAQRRAIRVRRGDAEEYIRSHFSHSPATSSSEPTSMQKGGRELEEIRPNSVFSALSWSIQGIFSKMLETIDEGIPIGLAVTVVGGIGKDREGPIIQAHPHVGFFMVDDFRTLAEYYTARSTSSAAWSGRFMLVGLGCLGYHVYKRRYYYLQYCRYLIGLARDPPSNVDWVRSTLVPASVGTSTLRTEDDEEASNEADECVICKTNKRKAFCVPCGHLCVCNECGLHLFDRSVSRQSSEKCPMCRNQLQGLNRVYE